MTRRELWDEKSVEIQIWKYYSAKFCQNSTEHQTCPSKKIRSQIALSNLDNFYGCFHGLIWPKSGLFRQSLRCTEVAQNKSCKIKSPTQIWRLSTERPNSAWTNHQVELLGQFLSRSYFGQLQMLSLLKKPVEDTDLQCYTAFVTIVEIICTSLKVGFAVTF